MGRGWSGEDRRDDRVGFGVEGPVAEDAMRNGVPREQRVRVPEHVVRRAFEAETVVLNLKTGQYHGVNETGARMLELLQETGSTDETAARIADEYGCSRDEVAGDLLTFCDELAARGLIELDGPGGAET